MCIDGSHKEEAGPYFGQWILFDDQWASAHPELADALLTWCARWDVLVGQLTRQKKNARGCRPITPQRLPSSRRDNFIVRPPAPGVKGAVEKADPFGYQFAPRVILGSESMAQTSRSIRATLPLLPATAAVQPSGLTATQA